MFDELKKMNEELAELKKKHLEKCKGMFTEVAKKVFEKHPALESFGWNQYTPYFNDGEECTFSANVDYPSINGIDSDDANFDCEKLTNYSAPKGPDGRYQEMDNEHYSPVLSAAKSDVQEFLNNIDESVLRDMFGDHVSVTVTVDGAEVDSYDHE